MRKLLAAILAGTVAWCAAESVPVQLISLSPRVFPAVERDRVTRLDYRMSISSLPNPGSINDELAFAVGDHGFTHEGIFFLEEPTTFQTIPFEFILDVPPFADENGNGLHDFFDFGGAIEGIQTTGFHDNGFGRPVAFSARWQREAGSIDGTVTIDLPFLGRRFNHAMSLFAYRGEFEFTRTGTNLSGTIALTNAANAADVIRGPFEARIVSPSRIVYSPGLWRGPEDFPFAFDASDTLDRSATSFISIVSFLDGFPATADEDYWDWLLVFESADANENGILDLVEQGSVERVEPRLSIERMQEGVRITVSGDPGSYLLQFADSLSAVQWRDGPTVTLSAATGSVIVPADEAARYYRVRAE